MDIFIFLVLMCVMSAYDVRTSEVPAWLLVLFSIVSLVLGVSVRSGISGQMLLGAGAGGAFFALQWLISRGRWIGGADIVAGLGMGAVLGWPDLVCALAAAYILGGAFGLFLLLTDRAKTSDEMPLLPFLTAGAILTALFTGRL